MLDESGEMFSEKYPPTSIQTESSSRLMWEITDE